MSISRINTDGGVPNPLESGRRLWQNRRVQLRPFSLALAVLASVTFSSSRAVAQNAATQRPAASLTDNDEWTREFPPFRMIGNVYWVGSYDLSTYLITSPQGHILVNTGVGDTAQKIKKGVESLGFKMSDIKVLTATHGHIDHAAGLAELKRLTGAQVVVSEREKELLETGGRTDFRFGKSPDMQFAPVKVDRTFTDNEKLTVGNVTLTTHLHAGHTRGATSFTFDIRENGKTYRVIIANMGSINPGVRLTGMPGYPEIAADYARTFNAQKELAIDVFLASHASQIRLHEKYKPGDPYNPDRFVDPTFFKESVLKLEKTFQDQLARDRAAAPSR